jgi:hypothetical protein
MSDPCAAMLVTSWPTKIIFHGCFRASCLALQFIFSAQAEELLAASLATDGEAEEGIESKIELDWIFCVKFGFLVKIFRVAKLSKYFRLSQIGLWKVHQQGRHSGHIYASRLPGYRSRSHLLCHYKLCKEGQGRQRRRIGIVYSSNANI